MLIREAQEHDLEDILAIWLEGAESSFAVAHYRREDLLERFRRNFAARDDVFAYWVAEDSRSGVIGWQALLRASSNPFRAQHVAESSTYVRRDARGSGLGTRLVEHAIACARETSLQYLLAYVSVDNVAARRTTTATGWVELGVMPALTRGPTMPAKVVVVCIL